MRCVKILQARVRGFMLRDKIRSMNNHKRFMPNDSYNNYTTANNAKIVNIFKDTIYNVSRQTTK